MCRVSIVIRRNSLSDAAHNAGDQLVDLFHDSGGLDLLASESTQGVRYSALVGCPPALAAHERGQSFEVGLLVDHVPAEIPPPPSGWSRF